MGQISKIYGNYSKSAEFKIGESSRWIKIPLEAIDRKMEELLKRSWRLQDKLRRLPTFAEVKKMVSENMRKAINNPKSQMSRLKIVLDYSPDVVERINDCISKFIIEFNLLTEDPSFTDAYYKEYREILESIKRGNYTEFDRLRAESKLVMHDPRERTKAPWLKEIESVLLEIKPVSAERAAGVKRKKAALKEKMKKIEEFKRTIAPARVPAKAKVRSAARVIRGVKPMPSVRVRVTAPKTPKVPKAPKFPKA